MHPKKAEMLRKLEEASRVHTAALERSREVVTNPGTFGWRRSILTAAVVVPLTGLSAVVSDVSHILIAHSDDDAWDRGDPSAPPPPLPKTDSDSAA
jgi:hypothetical protein